ncbi:MAG: ATP-binding protein [Prevotellaceae bacterium]|nr:ATP-binding protein [Prevotellaceae bacterium]
MKDLPVGIQSFEKLRMSGYLYVDKTKDILSLVSTSKPYFLSRPRRFGKSLTISVIQAIFEGRKELFEGLYIYDKWDWTKTNPVIRIDFGAMANRATEEVKFSLTHHLIEIAKSYKVTSSGDTIPDKFEALIKNLHQSTGEKVVVLVDEYDKPIVDNLTDLATADANRQLLHDFYQVLKAADDHLRFVFLTGVSKFSKVSLFSGLNSPDDITIDHRFATLCGYTQQELESCFEEHIRSMAASMGIPPNELVAKIRSWYNGYSWDGANTVYNPFSTLLLFTKCVFKDYWFATGTPTFLVNLIKERNEVHLLTEPSLIQESGFDKFDIRTLDTRLLLFQTGYLTIKKVADDTFTEQRNFTLDIPNQEVRLAMMEHMVGSFAAFPDSETGAMRSQMLHSLLDGNAALLEQHVKSLFARIPHQLHLPREAYYHSMLLVWLNMLGFKVEAEVLSTDKGRIDAVWTWGERAVIAEVKYSGRGATDKLIGEAFRQIKEKKYHERYADGKHRIALLAVAFAGKKIACQMQELDSAL